MNLKRKADLIQRQILMKQRKHASLIKQENKMSRFAKAYRIEKTPYGKRTGANDWYLIFVCSAYEAVVCEGTRLYCERWAK